MSSGNLVQLAFIAEQSYGVTPTTGDFSTARFTSEALSGTPDTVESKQIRTDRMSSGQVVVGLKVGGALNFELAKEEALDSFLESAMHSTWETVTAITVSLDVDATAKTLTRATGTWATDATPPVVGDILTLAGFTNTENNVQIMVAALTSDTVITFIGPDNLVTETGGDSYQRADKLTIGTTKKSFSIEKSFLDLTTKAINYRGMIVSNMDLNFAYGELATGVFGFSGNDQETVDQSSDFITNTRTIGDASTSQTLNGSVDMPFLATDVSGSLESDTLALQSVKMSLNNNLTAQNVIGDIAPVNYSSGTAQITLDISAYLNDNAWDLLAGKLDQTPFAIGFQVKNVDGWYGFYIPQAQVSFDDPASGGQNQDIILGMKGTAKVGENGESALYVFKGTNA
jgi:hypothetical protein